MHLFDFWPILKENLYCFPINYNFYFFFKNKHSCTQAYTKNKSYYFFRKIFPVLTTIYKCLSKDIKMGKRGEQRSWGHMKNYTLTRKKNYNLLWIWVETVIIFFSCAFQIMSIRKIDFVERMKNSRAVVWRQKTEKQKIFSRLALFSYFFYLSFIDRKKVRAALKNVKIYIKISERAKSVFTTIFSRIPYTKRRGKKKIRRH